MNLDAPTQNKPSLESLISNPDFTRTAQNLVNHFMRIYRNHPMIEPGDLLGEALLAATTVYQSYDVSCETSFKTFAFPYMRHAVQTYCHKFCHSLTISEKAARSDLKMMTDIGIIRIDHPSSQSSGEEFDAQNNRGERNFEIPVGSGVEAQIDLEEFFFAGFSQIERTLAREFLINDLSIRELANKYNISKSRVGSMLTSLRSRMKERAGHYVEED